MIHAYDKNYLSRAQGLLAVIIDFGVNYLNYSLKNFYDEFLNSKIVTLFENGDTETLGGKSGVELTLDIINDYSKADLYQPSVSKSPEYWTGWALAYFQWYSNLNFVHINDVIQITEIHKMYNPYHEMDISQFCDQMSELYNSRKTMSNIKVKRVNAGLSQSDLAKITNVPLRTIQQYEQKQKNINFAKAETILCIAKSLNCSAEELMEIK